MLRNTTINADAYCATLRRLCKAIQNGRRGKLSRVILLIHDNARPHTARQAQTLLHDEFHWDTLDHPPYSPDLAQSDFYLFLKRRSTLLVNDLQMMRTYSMLSWTGWIARRPSGTSREKVNWCHGMTSASVSKVTMWRSRWRCVIKPAYSVSFLLSINIFVCQNVLYLPNVLRTWQICCHATKLCRFTLQLTPSDPTTMETVSGK